MASYVTIATMRAERDDDDDDSDDVACAYVPFEFVQFLAVGYHTLIMS